VLKQKGVKHIYSL